MDFLKLVQQKEQKIDNKIIAVTVVFVVILMSIIVFWPSSSKHNLLSYLPENTSFYVHWHNKNYLDKEFFLAKESVDNRDYLKNILGSNFLNLQEAIFFQVDINDPEPSYLLRFSRLPRSFLNDLKDSNQHFEVYSPAKNILIIAGTKNKDYLAATHSKRLDYFDKGITIFWQKDNKPNFLEDIDDFFGLAFSGNKILLNWQTIKDNRNKLSLVENQRVDIKDIQKFFIPKNFDLAFGFSSHLSDNLAEKISHDILKTFFGSLPYYNLNEQLIKSRLLKDTLMWQRGESWLLASNNSFQNNILDFIDNFKLEEKTAVLSDGTAYTELLASDNQDILAQQINGQKVLKIDDLFIWDIEDKHYLTNDREMIEELSSYNRYLGSILSNCSENLNAQIGDFAYFESSELSSELMRSYLLEKNIYNVEMFSYATGSISGLNICF